MSKTLSSVAREEFDSDVKQAYQNGSKLRGTITLRPNVTGGVYHFRSIGKGIANQKPSQGDVTPMDIGHTKIPCVLQDWNAPEYTDIFDQAEVNFSEQAELAEVIAFALGRREDQLILDAASAATAAGTVAAAASGFTYAKANEASRILNAGGVPQMNRTMPISARGLEGLLNEEKLTSQDYQQVRAAIEGKISFAMGFNWVMIEDRDEGGVPIVSTTRTSTGWHKQAIGMATGLGPQSEVNYIAQKTSWLANGLLKANAVARDEGGLVDVAYVES